jgi:hypothetical protein
MNSSYQTIGESDYREILQKDEAWMQKNLGNYIAIRNKEDYISVRTLEELVSSASVRYANGPIIFITLVTRGHHLASQLPRMNPMRLF